MISRVAEHCYWMSRYLERLENTARTLEVNQTLLLDFAVPLEQQWKPLLIISGIHDHPADDGEEVQNFLTWDESNPSSIVSSLAAARENARIIREVISAEMWERVNYYHLWMKKPAALDLFRQSRTEFYGQVKRINQLLYGIGEGTMSHGEPWEFYRLAKYLERACQTARILDVKYHILLPTTDDVGTPVDSAHWTAILTSCSGYEPYHKKRVVRDPGVTVPDFLIFDPLFPRSVRYCLTQCHLAAHAISGRRPFHPGDEAEHALSELVRWLNLVKIDDLITAGLHEELTKLINKTHDVHTSIHKTYFDVRMTNGFVPPPQAGFSPDSSGHTSTNPVQ
ncbi:MAG: alpha-E domain-containing protein [Isosphaeraceae bacterium]